MVYLRAGWSLGNVPDRYIFSGCGSDQLVGRFVAMLPQHDVKFASLPPHFTSAGLALLQRVGFSRLVPCYEYLPSSFQRVVPYLIATLLHHEQWLKATFSDMNHPLWKSALFSHNLQTIAQLKQHVVTGIHRNEQTQMVATGMPGYITMAQKLKSLEEKMEKRDQEMMALMKEHHQLIIKMLDEQPERLRAHLEQHMEGIGPRAATQDELRKSISELKALINEKCTPMAAGSTVTTGSSTATTVRTVVDEATANQIWATDGSVKQMQHFWGEQFRFCCHHTCTSPIHEIAEVSPPHDFEFKNMPAKQAFSLWYLGNDRTCTGPYRLLAEKHHVGPEVNVSQYRKDLSSTKRVMKVLHKIAVRQHCAVNPSVPNPAATFRINKDNWSDIYDSAFEELQSEIYTNSSKDNRLSQLTIGSLCNQLGKHERELKAQQQNNALN